MASLTKPILIFLAALSLASSISAVDVRIQNDCSGKLRVKCHWKHDDLGNHDVAPGASFEWYFAPDRSEVSIWYCGFIWEHGSGVYDIYNSNRDIPRCNSCVWHVKPDGLHGISEAPTIPEVYFKWQATSTNA